MRNLLRVWGSGLIIGLFILQVIPVYADTHDHDNGQMHGQSHHDQGHQGHQGQSHHEHNYVGLNLAIWPDNYYYNPTYYSPPDGVLVSPPIYEPVEINGVTYYLNDGTYYIYNGYSYQAVAAPVPVEPPAVQTIEPPPVVDAQVQGEATDAYTINIPNDKGSFTAIIIKKSGNGFLGPQGEFYSEFPKVSQLKVMYGK